MDENQPQQESPIFRALRVMDDRRKELHSAINELEERLAPVICEPSVTKTQGEPEKTCSKTSMESRIVTATEETEQEITHTRDLINRLQV